VGLLTFFGGGWFVAYTTYAFFEWSLIIYDVAYDAVTAIEFQNFELSIVDKTGNTIIHDS
jgi:hypothetical protein